MVAVAVPPANGRAYGCQMTPALVAFLALTSLLSLSGSARGEEKLSVSVSEINLIQFPAMRALVAVTNTRGMPVPALGPTAFDVTDDGAPTRDLVVTTVRRSPEPIALIVAIDRSGSMKAETMRQSLAVARAVIRAMADVDLLGVVAFDDRISVLAPPTTQHGTVLEKLKTVRLGRDTALHDALLESLRLLATVKARRKLIIVLTDGKDTRSREGVDKVTALASDGRIAIHAVALGETRDLTALSRLTSVTGGVVIDGGVEGRGVEKKLIDLLGEEYIVSFQSPTALDKRWHRLSVTTRADGLRGAGTGSYLATLEPAISMRVLADYQSQRRRGRLLLIGGVLLGISTLLMVAIIVVKRQRALADRRAVSRATRR